MKDRLQTALEYFEHYTERRMLAWAKDDIKLSTHYQMRANRLFYYICRNFK